MEMRNILKVMIGLTLLSMVLVAIACPALAEGSAAATEQAYDWASLGTIAGATAATLMIVQFIKAPLDKVWKIPTRLLVYVIALILMLVAQVFTGGITVESALLAAVNAVMVALSAYGAYELTYAKTE